MSKGYTITETQKSTMGELYSQWMREIVR